MSVQKMVTLEDEQEQQSDDRLEAKISLPTETIEEIFSMLPVKSILRFRSVSKQWLKRISDPSFTKLHFARATAAHRTALFILPHPMGCYVFGFDESKNEHKILILWKLFKSNTLEIMIFSMSTYSWRNIHMEPPIGIDLDRLVCHREHDYYYTVCVNSVVHLLLLDTYDILGFDLRTDKFLIIHTPQGVMPHVSHTWYFKNGEYLFKDNNPRFIKINGCVGLVCHDRVLENNEMHIWILHDCENRVWVKEIITFPKPWIKLDEPFPIGSVNMDEVIFLKSKLFRDIANSVSIYNRKSRCFKDLQFTSGHQFPLSTTMQINQIGGYVESMVPL